MKVDQELLKMGQRLQIVFQTKKDTCFLLRSKLHLPIIMAENGADHSHLLPSPVTISLERKMTVFFSKLDIKKTPINARVVRLGGHLLLAQKVKLILAIMASLWVLEQMYRCLPSWLARPRLWRSWTRSSRKPWRWWRRRVLLKWNQKFSHDMTLMRIANTNMLHMWH